ncbi:hypothetical protein QBC46DRAFT_146372 [Diplogelasinospora grovesii]|uniref:Uncharacterized protein n=1 Tax=Diplogelasinospora grovesii TaxID=303347 RepID=A0AAN6S8X2_9PEZI|nr:hypothetical protein QBC46DRAFT_146372 [Diplogelasinospora grovesii]
MYVLYIHTYLPRHTTTQTHTHTHTRTQLLLPVVEACAKNHTQCKCYLSRFSSLILSYFTNPYPYVLYMHTPLIITHVPAALPFLCTTMCVCVITACCVVCVIYHINKKFGVKSASVLTRSKRLFWFHCFLPHHYTQPDTCQTWNQPNLAFPHIYHLKYIPTVRTVVAKKTEPEYKQKYDLPYALHPPPPFRSSSHPFPVVHTHTTHTSKKRHFFKITPECQPAAPPPCIVQQHHPPTTKHTDPSWHPRTKGPNPTNRKPPTTPYHITQNQVQQRYRIQKFKT